MLFKRYLTRYLILFLVILIMLQLVAGAYANAEHVVNYASESSEYLSRSVVQIGITLINRNNRKIQLNFIPLQFDYSSLEHILIVHSSQGKDLYNAALSDSYENINLINPHYFHGSKYKETNPFIL